ncbi:MAG: ABC-type transport system substrate-binding protein [Bacteriovoracaceae bacterium]|jgi:ABC-type transport system substrate-binding protein
MSTSPDPLNISYSGDWILTNHLWSPLLQSKSDGSFEGLIAKNWKRSGDGLIWDFELRDDLKWSDGSVMMVSEILKSLTVSMLGTSHTDLSSAIKKISIYDVKTIRFELNTYTPQFLMGLTYSDWAIIHPESLAKNNDGKYFVNKFKKLSGAFSVDSNFGLTKEVATKVTLLKNIHYPAASTIKHDAGELYSYDKCENLIENLTQVISFRMYKDDFVGNCKAEIYKHDYQIFDEEPSWIVKADFTSGGLERLPKSTRLNLIRLVQEEIKKDYKSIGNIRATGLRAPHLYGSLSELEFDHILKTFQTTKLNFKDLKIKIVVMESWSTWKSYRWLVVTLEKLGVNVVESILTASEFYSEFSSGGIQEKYDLSFIPLGVGDVDPDPSWRIASKIFYSKNITKKMLNLAYFERNLEKRGSMYKAFSEKLLSEGLYIPLVMNSDVVGVHKDFLMKEGSTLRNGMSFVDIE